MPDKNAMDDLRATIQSPRGVAAMGYIYCQSDGQGQTLRGAGVRPLAMRRAQVIRSSIAAKERTLEDFEILAGNAAKLIEYGMELLGIAAIGQEAFADAPD